MERMWGYKVGGINGDGLEIQKGMVGKVCW